MELREQMMEVSETVQETNTRVAALESKVDRQNAILEALAEREGIDVDELVTEVAIEEAEPEDGSEESVDDAPAEDAGDAEDGSADDAVPGAEPHDGNQDA
jgi:uncharacterized coiled-coil protein SlyX